MIADTNDKLSDVMTLWMLILLQFASFSMGNQFQNEQY